MKITLKDDATCGKVIIPKGDYMVALLSDSQQINLAGGGKDYKLPATKRRSASRTRVTTVSFYSGGGNGWSLIVTTPKHGEWIAMIEYDQSNSSRK